MRSSFEETQTKCQKCDRHVTTQFARVFGNNDDVVYGCPECTTVADLMSGEARLPPQGD